MLKRPNHYFTRFARFGGLLAVALEWLAIGLFYVYAPPDFFGQRPLSYFATLPQTQTIFALCFGLAAVSFWIFVMGHLRKHFVTPVKLFTFSMIGFLALALLPFEPESAVNNTIHIAIAFTMTLSLLLAIYLMAKHNDDKRLRSISLPVAAVCTALSLILMALPKATAFIGVQIIIGVCCQIWIIAMTFTTPPSRPPELT